MRTVAVLALCAIVGVASAMEPLEQQQPGTLRFLNATDASARCLDGSPGAYYYFPPAASTGAGKLILWLQGGGACTSPAGCLERSRTALGSSKSYPRTQSASDLHGVLSRNCTINPGFCDWAVVAVPYCDGFLYSGAREPPLVVNGTSLYLRGAAIRNALIADLAASPEVGLATSTDVILTGCSAGGYGIVLHAADMAARVRRHSSLAPGRLTIKAVPLSGFFLAHANYLFENTFRDVLWGFMAVANYSTQVDSGCTDVLPDAPPGTAGMCAFGAGNLAASAGQVSFFVVNSKTDAWQIPCILLANHSTNDDHFECLRAPGYGLAGGCADPYRKDAPFASCTEAQFRPIHAYQQAFLNELLSNAAIARPDGGAFVSSCYTHCEAMMDHYYAGVRVGGVSLHDALRAWYFQPGPEASGDQAGISARRASGGTSVPVAPHVHVDCARPATPPYECNPTCHVAASAGEPSASPGDASLVHAGGSEAWD